MTRLSLSTFIEELQSKGHYVFEKAEAASRLAITPVALNLAAARLANKGKLLALKRGFYLIIPAEYRGSAPSAPWYIDELMRFMGRPYYVGLLSAAALHGAAHHQPQEFQVISDIPIRRLRKGPINIRFFRKEGVLGSVAEQKKTPTGVMRVSTPELTALDLARYASKIGGLDLVAGVLAELCERIDPKSLRKAAVACSSTATVQRLGYILETLGQKKLAAPLATLPRVQRASMTLLATSSRVRVGPRNKKWALILNEHLDSEP